MKYRLRVGYTHSKDHVINEVIRRSERFAQNIEGDLVSFDHPEGVANNAPFEVAHDLGVTPAYMAVEDPGITGDGVYATLADREAWSDKTITVRSPNSNNKLIYVRVREKIDE